jgi:hypothetical protein
VIVSPADKVAPVIKADRTPARSTVAEPRRPVTAQAGSSARAGPIALHAKQTTIKKDKKIRPSGKHRLRIPSTSGDFW